MTETGKFELERVEDTRCVRLVMRGELDLYSSPTLDDALVAIEGEKWPVLFLDLRELAFIDSAGLRLVMRAHARAQQDGRRVVVIRGPETVDRVLKLTGLDAELEIVDGPFVPEEQRLRPDDPRLDPALLAAGEDARNVVDRYRFWRHDAIVADLDARRHPFHVAVENWRHDLNIGSVVRNANAFLAAAVHIVGARRWNRRGAMVTDRYQHVRHHPSLRELAGWAAEAGLPVLGIDNLPGSLPIDGYELPRECVLLFGQEGPGLSDEARELCRVVLAIRQFGSTRSINAAAASAVAMHEWVRRWA